VRPSQSFLVTALSLLAGGDNVVRDAVALFFAAAGLRLHVPNCYIGSGPAC
jgi:hypothetical protein